ncbi:MAG TPA: hypothetical protein PKD18_00325 [Saprospiraceae bacterium]|nr:hypothetical protein [Saprospiraceae bacterium]
MPGTKTSPPQNPFATEKRDLLWKEIINSSPKKVDKASILKDISDRKKGKR